MSAFNTSYTYVILMETTDENESIYFFIRYEGNEIVLDSLSSKIKDIIWYNFDGFSTFDLDTSNIVSEKTAREMCQVLLNSSAHRKFDGVIKDVDLDIEDTDSDEIKIEKVFDILGLGKIENFIDKEDRGSDCDSDSTSQYESDSN